MQDVVMPEATCSTTPGLEVPRLSIVVLHVNARALRDAPTPPFLGSTLRGALGHALRRLACTTGMPTCQGCGLAASCAYGAVWDGAGAADLGSLARGGDAPRPYVIAWERPAQRPNRLTRGDPLRFRVTLFGRAEAWLPFFVLAIRDALAAGLGSERSPFMLEQVFLAAPEDPVDTPSARALSLWSDGHLVPWAALPRRTLWALAQARAAAVGSRVVLRFETPLTLIEKDRQLDVPAVGVLVQRLTERMARLARAWGHADDIEEVDWQGLVRLAEGVRVGRVDTRLVALERHSMRSGAVPMSGTVGRMELRTVPAPILRLLAAGTWVHVGKQATFGFGRLGLERPERSDL